MNVLIVGDDRTGNKLLRVSLELKGHSVFTAENGMEAILFLDQFKQIDLIISDANMPRANGYTFLTAVRTHPHHCDKPFIMYSASFTDYSHESLAIDLGANRFVRKSGQMKEIIEAAEEFFPNNSL